MILHDLLMLPNVKTPQTHVKTPQSQVIFGILYILAHQLFMSKKKLARASATPAY